jgi:hypothetical protein
MIQRCYCYSAGALDQLIDNRCLVLNWVPILLHTDDDIEFATRKKTKVDQGTADVTHHALRLLKTPISTRKVLIEGQITAPKSFSVLSLPFQCQAGVSMLTNFKGTLFPEYFKEHSVVVQK